MRCFADDKNDSCVYVNQRIVTVLILGPDRSPLKRKMLSLPIPPYSRVPVPTSFRATLGHLQSRGYFEGQRSVPQGVGSAHSGRQGPALGGPLCDDFTLLVIYDRGCRNS